MVELNSQQQAIEQLRVVLAQAEYRGVRRLLVLSGQPEWCYQQAEKLTQHFVGDWLWVTDRVLKDKQTVASHKIKAWLGREIKHLIFDGLQGINADSLAAVSGSLLAGGLLVMLVPEWHQWSVQADQDSLRWNEQDGPIATPHFVQHLQRCLLATPDLLIWQQGQSLRGDLLPANSSVQSAGWQQPLNQPTVQQQRLLNQLLIAPNDYYLLTALRGRGKSALAGMLVAKWTGAGECWLTGPNKLSVEQVLQWSNNKARFWAPDVLIEYCSQHSVAQVDWLIIDEAAAIPTPLLTQLVHYFPRILFTTTVLGYEGTGRGFLLKFCTHLPHYQQLTLTTPIRWADDDPLETLINEMLLLTAEESLTASLTEVSKIVPVCQSQLANDERLLSQFYGLLTSSHYRTTALDLRRLLDAPDQHFQVALDKQNQVVAGLWCVSEGDLSQELSHEIWAGRRRPRGNLLAQSLSAHGGLYQAPLLRSIRVSRIAVQPEFRRQGIARQLITAQIKQCQADGLDYLSVSFGYTEELWQFWQSCGFQLIHMGSKKEASSGCYAAMAIIPFSQQGQALLTLGLSLLSHRQNEHDSNTSSKQIQLDEQAWFELAGFAFAFRTLESARYALHYLTTVMEKDNPDITLLRDYLNTNLSDQQIMTKYRLTGKKALVEQCRQITGRCLLALDHDKALHLQRWVNCHN